VSSLDHWFRKARLVALLLSVATPGCLAEMDEPGDFGDPVASDEALDPGAAFDVEEEPSLELMAEGQYRGTHAVQQEDRRYDGQGMVEVGLNREEGEDDGEPTPQPWHDGSRGEPGDDDGPDPVPWEVSEFGPDPVPWYNDDDFKASATGEAEGRERRDPF